MKHLTLLSLPAALVFSILFISPASAQQADSIRIEQAGDFVKIFYKIVGSNQNQTFRVSLMASINGGLRSEPRSVSGDVGENIVGGKSEYWILWDVLKDVEELTSVEFFVKSELLRDLSEPEKIRKTGADNKYQKRIFNIMPMVSMPGPRVGGMIGVNGPVGFLAGVAYGKIAEPEAILVPIGGSEQYETGTGIQMTVNLTARIVSNNSFQLHAVAGFSAAAMDYLENDNTNILYQNGVMTNGFSAGLLMGSGRISAALIFMKYDPGSVEKKNEGFYLMTPMNLFTAGIGVRF